MADEILTRDHFFTAADGLKLHAREWAPQTHDATPIVCLPGLARTAEDFAVIGQRLAAGAGGAPRRVVALDYRGRGLSDRDKNWRNYDIRVENADILTVLTGLGIEEAIYLGTSRGGLHIMVLAATRPGSIRAAILNDVGPVLESKGLAHIRGYVGKLPSPRSWSDAQDLFKGIMSARFTGLEDADWLSYAKTTFEEKEGKFIPRYDPNLARVLGSLDLSEPLPALWAQFDGLKNRPLMIVRGENSDLLSEETFEAMAERHPGAKSLVVPGQGHAPLLLDDVTIGEIAAFAANVDHSVFE